MLRAGEPTSRRHSALSGQGRRKGCQRQPRPTGLPATAIRYGLTRWIGRDIRADPAGNLYATWHMQVAGQDIESLGRPR